MEFSADASLNQTAEALTLECWVKPEDVRPYMMIAGRDGPIQRYWKLGVYGRHIAGSQQNVVFSQFFSDSLGGHRLLVEEPFVIPLGEWSHLAFTYGNGRRRLYVNGRLVDEVPATGKVPAGNLPLTIGARGDGTETFRGAIDHVAVYRAEIEPHTIKQHYRAFRDAIGAKDDTVELAAWRAFCQSLFCLNEFVYVD